MKSSETKAYDKCKSRGSMTVEAVIALPVFLMLFLFMMYMVNVGNIYLTLNHAVDQTVKFNANNAYIYSKIDGLSDTEEADKENKEAVSKLPEDMLNEILVSGEPQKAAEKVFDVIESLIFTAGKNYLGEIADDSLNEIFRSASERLLILYAENSKIDGSKVKLTLYKMPGSEPKGSTAKQYQNIFDSQDIVVQASYEYTMDIPLIGVTEFPIASTCVEKAWTKGSNGEYINVEDSSFFERLAN